MIIVRLDDTKRALQLKETLLEAGFTSQEVSLTIQGEGSSALWSRTIGDASADMKGCLTVKTQTQADEELVKIVARDCGIGARHIETPSALSLVLPRSRLNDRGLRK